MAALAADPAPSHVSLVPTTLARILDRDRRRATARDPARRPAGWRPDPAGPRPAGARGGLAGRPDLRPDRGRVRGHRPPDRRGSRATRRAPAGHSPGSSFGSPTPDADGGRRDRGPRAPALFDGYLDDPAATAAALTDDGWLRTGDLGRLDADGRLTVADRRTDRIVRGGENISPSEVEAVLLEHPAIADAGVVARPRPRRSGTCPVAAIVLRSRRAGPRRRRPDPRSAASAWPGSRCPVAFIRLDDLPRTPNGKLRRARPSRPSRSRRDGRATTASTDPTASTIAYRTFGDGPRHVLLLHGTLSTAAQLTGLARLLAAAGDLTVHAVDRRGSGASRLAEPDADRRRRPRRRPRGDPRCRRHAPGSRPRRHQLRRLPRPRIRRPAPRTGPPRSSPTNRRTVPRADAATQAVVRDGRRATEARLRAGGSARRRRGIPDRRRRPGRLDRPPDRARAFLADEGGGAYADAGPASASIPMAWPASPPRSRS